MNALKSKQNNFMKSSILSILLIFSVLAYGQNKAIEAKTLLESVSSKVKSYENMSIDFKYTVANALSTSSQETRGSVIIEGNNYVLNILGVTRIFDGSTLYTISPEDEEVTISSNNTDDDSSITPNAMLSFYETGYTYAMDITQDVNGRKIKYVKLTPTEVNSGLKHVLLGIDNNTHHIYNLIEVGSDNTRSTLTVNSFKTNEPLSKTLFTFDESKYSDYFINRID